MKSNRNVLVSVIFGQIAEFYDFFIFILFADSLSNLFFVGTRYERLFKFFILFGIGYVARPIGAIILSHFGDKYGRKRSLTYSVGVAGIATILVGCLPTYSTIGIYAPIFLLLARIIQGVALGCDLAGSVAIVYENSDVKRSTLPTAVLHTGLSSGVILATIVFITISSSFVNGTIFSSWRSAFFLGGLLSFFALYMRLSIHESEIFHIFKKNSNLVSYPFFYLIFFKFTSLLKGIGLGFFIMSILVFYVLLPEMLYLFYGFKKHFVFFIVNFSCIISITITIFSGYIIDKYKLNKTFIFSAGCIVLILTTPAISYFIFYSNNIAFVIAYIIFGIINGVNCSCYFSLTAELFDPYIRFTGLSISFSTAIIFGGASVPLIANYLISKTYPTYVITATVILSIIISLLAVLWIYFSSAKHKTGNNEIL
ncbi:MAG TPA: MFS transporter [Victivallales bacterium]|nr:MFS transporter [Victivallales bacterium]